MLSPLQYVYKYATGFYFIKCNKCNLYDELTCIKSVITGDFVCLKCGDEGKFKVSEIKEPNSVVKKEGKLCSIRGCNGKLLAKGYCVYHRYKIKVGRCFVRKCKNNCHKDGYCDKHYIDYAKE
jgi:hypothetical protein